MPSITVNYSDLALRRQREHQQRLAHQQRIWSNFNSKNPDGEIGKIRQMSSYSPEAVAGALLAQLLLSLLLLLSNTPFWARYFAHLNNKIQEIMNASIGLRLIYQPDTLGRLPEIYPMGKNGIDFEAAPVQNPDEALILRNGYSIPPYMGLNPFKVLQDFGQGLQTAMDMHIASILGQDAISELAKLRIHGGQLPHEGQRKDLDPNAVNQLMHPRPVRVG